MAPLPATERVAVLDEKSEAAPAPKTLKRKHKPVVVGDIPAVTSLAASTIDSRGIHDGKGNIFYRLKFTHKHSGFFRYNEEEIQTKLAEARISPDHVNGLIPKIKSAVEIGRVLPSHSHQPGLTAVTAKERGKFSTNWKLWIREDARLEVDGRHASEDEEKLGIEEVYSPRNVRFH